jgi:hypothetical protein
LSKVIFMFVRRAKAAQASVAWGWNAVTALEARKVRGLQDA